MLFQGHLLLRLLLGFFLPTTIAEGEWRSGNQKKPNFRYIACLNTTGQKHVCKTIFKTAVCVLDYRNQTEPDQGPCLDNGLKSEVCNNSVPEQLTCIPNVGCCCKATTNVACNDDDAVGTFCANNEGFPDHKICPPPTPSLKCTNRNSSVDQCATGADQRCKVDSSGQPAGCTSPSDPACDHKRMTPGLQCKAGKGCCCIPTPDGRCNSRTALENLCKRERIKDEKICPSPNGGKGRRKISWRSLGPHCADQYGSATLCTRTQPYCKTDLDGNPKGCVKINECYKDPHNESSNIKCSNKDCCCNNLGDFPCNSWDDFCIAKPKTSTCQTKRRKCLDVTGKVSECPLDLPVCLIDMYGNPGGCISRDTTLSECELEFSGSNLTCTAGEGCCCNADFGEPCNTRANLAEYCASADFSDDVLCPRRGRFRSTGRKAKYRSAKKRTDKHPEKSGCPKVTPLMGLVMTIVYIGGFLLV